MSESLNPHEDRSPYKLLEYYDEADATIFGGRDQEIFDVTSRLASRGIVILYGPSGTGKTSIVRAGVFPQVRKLDWNHLYVRTLTNPIEDLRAAIKANFNVQECGVNTVEDLVTKVDQLAKVPLLLTFDQFEEFFIRFKRDPALKLKFISAVSNIVKSTNIDCRILFCLREDYFANFDEFRRYIPDIFDNSYRIGPLSAFGAREAIILPLNNSGIQYDNRVINSLIVQLADYGFDPVFLQILCSELIRTATLRGSRGSLAVTMEDLRNLGGIESIFQNYLESAILDLEPALGLVARLVLDSLTTGEHTKQAMRIADFEREQFVASVAEIETVLDALRRHRIVRHDVRSDEAWFELVHERLVSLIQRWIRADPAFFKFMIARDLVEFSGRTSQHQLSLEALLNRGQVEGVVTPNMDRLKFTDDQMQFIFLSCIFSESSEVQTWFLACGLDRARQILLRQSDSESHLMRRGVARVISRVPQAASKPLISKCLELALSDSDESVRRAAGRAFGQHADDEDLVKLKSALSDKSGSRALEVYADVLAVGKAFPSVGYLSTFRAKRIARKRALRQEQDFLSSRARAGFTVGAAVAVLWSLLFIPAWLAIVPMSKSDPRFGIFTVVMSICFPLSCIVGFGLGGLFASHSAKRDVLQRDERWVLDAIFSLGYWIILFIYLLGVVIWLGLMRNELSENALLGGLLGASYVPVIWLTVLPSTLWLAQQCVDYKYTKSTICGWPAITALITPTTITGGLLFVAYRVFEDTFPSPTSYLFGFMTLTLFSTAISTISLASVTVPRLMIPKGSSPHDGGSSS